MAVHVRTTRVVNGTRYTATHPTGDHFSISEGHLIVGRRGIPVEGVALYAPGAWTEATTDEAPAQGD